MSSIKNIITTEKNIILIIDQELKYKYCYAL